MLRSYTDAIDTALSYFSSLVSAGYPPAQFLNDYSRPAPPGLASYNSNPTAPLASVWRRDPGMFLGLFPALVVPPPMMAGPLPADEVNLAGLWDFSVEILCPTAPRTPGADGRLEAQTLTEHVAGMVMDAIALRPDIDGEVSRLVHTGSIAGDFDRMGNVRVDQATRSILWVTSLTFRAEL